MALILAATGPVESGGASAELGQRVVLPRHLNLYQCPSLQCAVVGSAQRGGRLDVEVSQVPPAEGAAEWIELGGPAFAREAQLGPLEPMQPSPPLPEDYRHGVVRRGGLTVYEKPDLQARHHGLVRAGRDLALLSGRLTEAPGWLERPAGGFVQEGRVRLHAPSALEGIHSPKGALAFVIRGPHRYDSLPVSDVSAAQVTTGVGVFSRSEVRLAIPTARPRSIPPGVQWIHVDLEQQVLMAYEGDRPVFATLVSTGKPLTPTTPGLFRVYLKSRHDRMHGDGYDVEEVPSILYFHQGEALHGAFWHDHFGNAVTHGCVNLSPRDAAWLFAWSLPVLPAGWHSRVTQARDEALWIWVTHHASRPLETAASQERQPTRRSSSEQVMRRCKWSACGGASDG